MPAAGLLGLLLAALLPFAVPEADWHVHPVHHRHSNGTAAGPTPKPRDGQPPPGVSAAAAAASVAKLEPELFASLPPAFLPELKTPCFHANGTGPLRCLPYYFILGDFQCGVRDLATRLARHPQVVRPGAETPHWWDERRDGGSWERFWPMYESAAARLAPGEVLGDTSYATFAFTWAGSGRTNWPWSRAMAVCRKEACKEDAACIAARCYQEAAAAWHPTRGDGSSITLPYLMRYALGANVKHVVLVRDPVERLHAAYWGGHHYLNRYGRTEAGFAAFVNGTLADMAACRARQSAEQCVQAFEAWSQEQEDGWYHCDQLAKGAYSVFLKGWLGAFPKADVLVLRLEDIARTAPDGTRTGLAAALRAVETHLGLAPAQGAAWEAMLEGPITRGSDAHSVNPGRVAGAAIDPEVRAAVGAFYREFDAELEGLLGKPGFADWHGEATFL